MTSAVDDEATPGSLEQMIARWVDAGAISAAQGERIRTVERAHAAAHRSEPASAGSAAGRSTPDGPAPAASAGAAVQRPPAAQSLVVEALAYVGGVIVLAAAGWTAAQLWSSLGTAARLGVLGAVAALLLGAGAAVPARHGGAGHRLRSVLWLLASAAFVGFVALLGADQWSLADRHVALLAATTTLGLTAGLWRLHRAAPQNVGFVAALVATVAALTAQLQGGPDALPALAVTGAALAWLALAWGGVVPYQVLNTVLGGGGAIVGATITGLASSANWGIALTLAVLGAVLLLAVAANSLPLLGVGAVGSLVTLPRVLGRFFPQSLAAPLVLVAVGLLMVAAAVYIARRAKGSGRGAPALFRASRAIAITAAAAVAAGFAAAVVVLGL